MEQNQLRTGFEMGQSKENVDNTSYIEVEKQPQPKLFNKTFIKGIVTGVLILVMLIPTAYVSNLVSERQKRQEEVVNEVKSVWAKEQRVYGPYIVLPYVIKSTDTSKKVITQSRKLVLLPENLNVATTLHPEIRLRSIYKVLLYRSEIKSQGEFSIKLPKDIDPTNVDFNNASICYNITDFKGIEEKVNIGFNGNNYGLSPGLPIVQTETIKKHQQQENIAEVSRPEDNNQQIECVGLSSPISLKAEDLAKPIQFSMNIKLRGSESLHFVPLSANSAYTVQSEWNSPKFDGNSLPIERNVSKDGFTAKWNYNNANFPFGTVLTDFSFGKEDYAFGVSMVQPTSQYAKTARSTKYAILFIGLTFALFFIIELLQNKPLHPVQYTLIGIALVIFFSLLLSISEFIAFDFAYLIATLATVGLISIYAKAHFKNIKSALTLSSLLLILYTFIFVLIQLEDAALLVGSIGLFFILALIMYVSRKIDWYGIAGSMHQNATVPTNDFAHI